MGGLSVWCWWGFPLQVQVRWCEFATAANCTPPLAVRPLVGERSEDPPRHWPARKAHMCREGLGRHAASSSCAACSCVAACCFSPCVTHSPTQKGLPCGCCMRAWFNCHGPCHLACISLPRVAGARLVLHQPFASNSRSSKLHHAQNLLAICAPTQAMKNTAMQRLQSRSYAYVGSAQEMPPDGWDEVRGLVCSPCWSNNPIVWPHIACKNKPTIPT